MPTPKMIDVIATCPECEAHFEAEIEEADLLTDPEEPLAFDCPDCDCEFEQAYTFTDGVVTLSPEVTITSGDLEDDEDGFAEESDEEDDEDEE